MKLKHMCISLLTFVLIFSFIPTQISMPVVEASTAVTAYNATGTITTQKDPLTLRASASTSGKVLGSIPKGTKITITGTTSNWYRVTYNNVVGFVSKSYVTITTTTNPTPTPTPTPVGETVTAYSATGTVTTNSDPLTLRASANSSAKVLASIPKGAKITITGVSTNWYRVNYKNMVGFASKSFVTINTTPSKVVSFTTKFPIKAVSLKGTATKKASVYKTQQPVASNTVLTSIPVKTTVTIIGTEGDLGLYYKVKYKNQTGYVLQKEIEVHKTVKEKTAKLYTVMSAAKVYSSPSTSSKVKFTAKKQTVTKVTGESGKFYRVTDTAGSDVWIEKSKLVYAGESSKRVSPKFTKNGVTVVQNYSNDQLPAIIKDYKQNNIIFFLNDFANLMLDSLEFIESVITWGLAKVIGEEIINIDTLDFRPIDSKNEKNTLKAIEKAYKEGKGITLTTKVEISYFLPIGYNYKTTAKVQKLK